MIVSALLSRLASRLQSRQRSCLLGSSIFPIGSAWTAPSRARDIDFLILLENDADRLSLFQELSEILREFFSESSINAVTDYIPTHGFEARSVHLATYDGADLLTRKPRALLNALYRPALLGQCSWKPNIAETYWSISDLRRERWGLEFCESTLAMGYWISHGWFGTMRDTPQSRQFCLGDPMTFASMVQYAVSKAVINVQVHTPPQSDELKFFLGYSSELGSNWFEVSFDDFHSWLRAFDKLLSRYEMLPQESGEVLARRLASMNHSLDATSGQTRGN